MTAASSSTGSHAITAAARHALRRSTKQRGISTSIIQNLQEGSITRTSTATTTTTTAACGVCSARHPFSTSATASAGAASADAGSSSSSSSAFAASATTTTPSSTQPVRKSALIRPVRIVPPRKSTLIAPKTRKPPKTHQPPVRQSTVDQRTAQVSKLYALQAIPPHTSLAALANRISSLLLGSESKLATESTREEWLKKIELCCVCPSFWNVVREEERQEEIRRFQEQQQQALSSENKKLPVPEQKKQYTNYLDAQKLHNEGLATLGNHLLGVFAIEWLEARYPRLPTTALKAALTLSVGPRTCADIASRQWGISSGQAAQQAFLGIPAQHISGQPLRGVGEGNRSGLGLLRWGKPSDDDLKNLVQRTNPAVKSREENDHRTPLPLEEALASAARSVVGLVFQEHGFVAARQFVHANFLSRSIDIPGLLKFPNPKYTLSSTLTKQSMQSPTTRILAETGRLSIAPVFVLGVYSGTIKLGEGYGSSLAMAEYRACEDALKRIYLSSEEKFENIFKSKSASGMNEEEIRINNLIAKGHAGDADSIKGYPSDTIVVPGSKLATQLPLMDDETLYQSSGKSSVMRR